MAAYHMTSLDGNGAKAGLGAATGTVIQVTDVHKYYELG